MSDPKQDLISALQAALSNVGEGSDDALTMEELVKATGRGYGVLRRELWALNDAGLLEVTTVKRPRIDGVISSKTAYRVKEAANED